MGGISQLRSLLSGQREGKEMPPQTPLPNPALSHRCFCTGFENASYKSCSYQRTTLQKLQRFSEEIPECQI